MTMIFVLAVTINLVHFSPATGEEMVNLGTVEVGEYQGQILFQYPGDEGKSYRIDVAISKPNGTEPIDSGRFDV